MSVYSDSDTEPIEPKLYAEIPNADTLTDEEIERAFLEQAVADLADFLPPPTDAEIIIMLTAQCSMLKNLHTAAHNQAESLLAQLAAERARRESAEAALIKIRSLYKGHMEAFGASDNPIPVPFWNALVETVTEALNTESSE